MAFEDILYEKEDGVATITINRPKVLNAFRAETVEEMLAAMRDAEADPAVGVIVLAGAGDRAFCAGGDNSARAGGAEKAGGYGGRGLVGLPIEVLNSVRLLARARQDYVLALTEYNQAQLRLFVSLGQPPQ